MLKFQFSFSYYHLPNFHNFFSFSAPLLIPKVLNLGCLNHNLLFSMSLTQDVVVDLEDLHMKQFNEQTLNK